MNTNEGKWILEQDSPLLDQIAVEMPYVSYRKYMTLRDLINGFMENDIVAHRVKMVESSVEDLLIKLKDLKKGE